MVHHLKEEVDITTSSTLDCRIKGRRGSTLYTIQPHPHSVVYYTHSNHWMMNQKFLLIQIHFQKMVQFH